MCFGRPKLLDRDNGFWSLLLHETLKLQISTERVNLVSILGLVKKANLIKEILLRQT